MFSTRFTTWLAIAMGALTFAGQTLAQPKYPAQPVKVIVALPATR